ncbi:hypothetical protein B0H14DRAFT_2350760, partial [Mycena olivaceomarginata]
VYRACEVSGLAYRDSMHLNPDANVLSIFQWFLSATGFPVPMSVESVNGEVQGAGSGSCAIAALNFVETDLNSSIPLWTTSTSPLFRNGALGDLILYHLTVLDQGVQNVSDCVSRIICTELFLHQIYDEPLPSPEEPSIDYGPVGYDDFNVLAPNVRIHSYIFSSLILSPSHPIRFIGFWTEFHTVISQLR